MEVGYWLSSEEHGPKDLVENAQRAEQAGFSYVLISDHYHPWINEQGHSPFVWSVIGAIGATTKLGLGTGVTCPLVRYHPALVAQAAATSQILMDGRFFLGVGSGENLNEHIFGDRWPRPDERLEMLEEAIDVIRALFSGEYETFRGKHYTVEQARIYDMPDTAPPIVVAAANSEAAKLAGKKGDGFISTEPDEEVVKDFKSAGGKGPLYGKITGAFAKDEDAAKKMGKERQPNAAMGGALSQELALPRDFEAVADLVREDDVAESLVLGSDADVWREKIEAYDKAGFTHVCLHHVGTEQQPFIDFAKQFLS
jgi:coenzyme F420-dependent glucose-6-phosphate dehydrogenase